MNPGSPAPHTPDPAGATDPPNYEPQGWSTTVYGGLVGTALWIFGPANDGVQEAAFEVKNDPEHVFLRPFHRSNESGGDPGLVRYAFLADPGRRDARVALAAALRLNPQDGPEWAKESVFIFPGLRMNNAIPIGNPDTPLHKVDHLSVRTRRAGDAEIYVSTPRNELGEKDRVAPRHRISPNEAGGFYLGSMLVASWDDLDPVGYAKMRAGPGIVSNPTMGDRGVAKSVMGEHLVSMLPTEPVWDADHYLTAGLHLTPRQSDGVFRFTHVDPRYDLFAAPNDGRPVTQHLSVLRLGEWDLGLSVAIVPGEPREFGRSDGKYQPRGGFTFKHRT